MDRPSKPERPSRMGSAMNNSQDWNESIVLNNVNATQLYDLEDISNLDNTKSFLDENNESFASNASNSTSITKGGSEEKKKKCSGSATKKKSGAGDENEFEYDVPEPTKKTASLWKSAAKVSTPNRSPPTKLNKTAADDEDQQDEDMLDALIQSSSGKAKENKVKSPSSNSGSASKAEAGSKSSPPKSAKASLRSPSSTSDTRGVSSPTTSGDRKTIFGNIYETSKQAEMLEMPTSASSPKNTTDKKNPEDVNVRIRLLEAEARVRARERIEFDEEMRKSEQNWATELIALGIRNQALEAESKELKEVSRKAKIEISKLLTQVSTLEANAMSMQMRLGSSQGKAERESLGTVLAQQKLVSLLDEHKRSADAQVTVLKEENSKLKESHKQAVEECLDWKTRAIEAESKAAHLKTLVEQTAEAGEFKTSEINIGLAESKSVVSDAIMSAEACTRRVLNQEMEKFLSLERSSATPVLARFENEYAMKFVARESQFDSFLKTADEIFEAKPEKKSPSVGNYRIKKI